jgi:uncharacterized protein (DUF305 family)
MDKNTVLVIAVLIALVAGVSVGYTVRGGQVRDGMHMMPGGGMMHDSSMGMGDAMDSMMAGLEGKTGDEFDKAFLSEMIMHHQGAVLMAEAARARAKHQEIKDMAEAIISAQTNEINQMQAWGRAWYGQ